MPWRGSPDFTTDRPTSSGSNTSASTGCISCRAASRRRRSIRSSEPCAFFYGTTLGNKQLAEEIPFGRVEDTLPAVLTREQVLQLIKAERSFKMRTMFITIYAAGLRVSEAVKLTTSDVDSKRQVIHVRQGKGHKDRYVMLSEQLLNILRNYWRRTRPPEGLLFPGTLSRPITTRSVQRALRETADRAGLGDAVRHRR